MGTCAKCGEEFDPEGAPGVALCQMCYYDSIGEPKEPLNVDGSFPEMEEE